MERFKVTEQSEEPEAEVDTPDSTDEPGQEGNRYTVPLKDADSPAKEKVEEDVPTETRHIMAMDPIRFVHSDLRTYNVLLHNGHISGVVDWQDSGWFPSSWQVHTMRWARVGCDRFWLLYWRDVHRFSPEAEAAYAASKTFLIQSPV